MSSIQLKITGEGSVTSLLKEYSWVDSLKLERNFSFDSTLVAGKDVDLTDFATIDFLIVESDKAFTATLTKGVGEAILEAKNTLLISPDEVFTNLNLISKSSEGQDFSIRIYEEV